jgi:anti-anti-sigma factor
MEFKIDTKDNFTVITPAAGGIDAKLAEELADKCTEVRQSGSNNLIIDLTHCNIVDNTAVKEFIKLHEESYSEEQSLVFTGVSKAVMDMLKEDESDLLLNIAPKMQEAIDIVSMEVLERDLFNEE